jgi:antitoxin MazE
MQEDDEKELHATAKREEAVARMLNLEELIKRLRAFRGHLPDDFRFDRDEANSR